MTPHVKHIIWAMAVAACILGGLTIRGVYEEHKAKIMADRDTQIAANQAKVQDAQKTVQNAQEANRGIDAATKARITNLEQQLASRPSSSEIQHILQATLPGLTVLRTAGANGDAVLSVPDTQANRDAINQAVTNAKICTANLDDCQAKQANLNTIIGGQKNELLADESTINLQAKQIKDLKAFQVPRWTLMAGVGKTQGTNFNDINNYQPVIGLDYRLSGRIGVFGLAQNKSAAVGLSWRFGATK